MLSLLPLVFLSLILSIYYINGSKKLFFVVLVVVVVFNIRMCPVSFVLFSGQILTFIHFIHNAV